MKTLDLGNGLTITESPNMGLVLHFETKDGALSGGIFLEPDFAGYAWALEMLAEIPDTTEPGKISKNKHFH
jgi:hypothetical protein